MTALTTYFARPAAQRLDQQRRAIIGTAVRRPQASWKIKGGQD